MQGRRRHRRLCLSCQFKDDEEHSLFIDLANEWIHTQGLKRSHLIADTTEADVLPTAQRA
jgi:hypothetical protein